MQVLRIYLIPLENYLKLPYLVFLLPNMYYIGISPLNITYPAGTTMALVCYTIP